MYKVILWDNDGILVQTEKWYYKATKDVMSEYGFNLTLDIYHEYFLNKNSGAWHLLKDIDESKINLLKDKRNQLYSNYIQSKDILIEGVPEILEALHHKYKMGIVTSSRRDHFNQIHAKTCLLKYFQFVVANDEFAKSKPDPEPYLIGIKKSGFKADKCLSIEDSERGMRSAKNAKLDCWVIPGEMTKYGSFKKADKILNRISDLQILL
jgi:HAD superfamily hydrolase (TIGR01509 family)